MIGLYIFAAVLCVLLILLYSRVRVTVKHDTASGEEPQITISYLFLRINLSPKAPRSVDLRDYTYKRFQKAEKKRLKAEARAAEKAKIKEEKKEAAKKAKAEAKAAAKKAKKDAKNAPATQNRADSAKKPEKKKTGVIPLIWDIKHLIFRVLVKFPTKLRLDVSRLHLRVGGKDAATAAITYGAVTEAVGALLAVLDSFMKVKRDCKNEIEIVPDFLSGKIDADIHICVSIAPAGVLSVVFGFIGGLIAHFIKKIKIT